MAGLLTSLLLSLILGNWFIKLSSQFFRSRYRKWTPETHKQKENIPTMGGMFVLFVININVLAWCNLTDPRIWIFLLCLNSFGIIGFLDDWQKITNRQGISSSQKFTLQCLCAAITAALLYFYAIIDTTIVFPFFKNLHPAIGYFIFPWIMLVIISTSNAVNLTDGLDGLATGSLLPNFALFSIISYLAGHTIFATYLQIPYSGTAEVAIIGSILIGASTGFLWYNTHPAQVFMGDIGSLSLGAGLAVIALMTKQELLLILAGGLFVAETISVIIQVASVRYFGRRLFKMAPLHHHFELLGWQESKITVRFNIITSVLCLLALITLKIR